MRGARAEVGEQVRANMAPKRPKKATQTVHGLAAIHAFTSGTKRKTAATREGRRGMDATRANTLRTSRRTSFSANAGANPYACGSSGSREKDQRAFVGSSPRVGVKTRVPALGRRTARERKNHGHDGRHRVAVPRG